MIGIPLVWLVLVGFFVASLAAIAARALQGYSRHELEQYCERHQRAALPGEILARHERVATSAESLEWVASGVAVAALASVLCRSASAGAGPAWLVVAAAFVGGLLLLAANVWIPRAVVRVWATPFLFHTWHLWKFTDWVFAFSALGGRLVDHWTARLSNRRPQTPSEESLEDEIRTIVSEGQREGLIEEDAREMIEGVIDLGDADVGSIMTPRTSMMSMPVGLSIQEAAEFVVESGHSRIPVYDKSRDDVIGILYSKDLLAELAKEPAARRQTVGDIVRPPSFVPESKPVDELLQEFQRSRNHMAVVLDEFGGVAGLVTIEDILEEIVGEIADEHDVVVGEGIRRIDERTSEVLASVRIDEINEQLGLGISEGGDFDTIGGFVFGELGHVPTAGEQLVWKNFRITVLEVAQRRIDRLRIEVLDEAHSEPV